MSNNTKAMLVFISIMFLITTVILFGYHKLYVHPVNLNILKTLQTNKIAWERQIQLDYDITNKMKSEFYSQYLINHTTSFIFRIQQEIDEEQDMEIKRLNKKVNDLERRHLETLRAICILQKKHWREK